MTIDHLVCWEAGGATVEPNLLTACKRCNKTRGNISYEAWLKHPRYREVSKKLPEARRQANEALLATLPNIQLNVHARTR